MAKFRVFDDTKKGLRYLYHSRHGLVHLLYLRNLFMFKVRKIATFSPSTLIQCVMSSFDI